MPLTRTCIAVRYWFSGVNFTLGFWNYPRYSSAECGPFSLAFGGFRSRCFDFVSLHDANLEVCPPIIPSASLHCQRLTTIRSREKMLCHPLYLLHHEQYAQGHRFGVYYVDICKIPVSPGWLSPSSTALAGMSSVLTLLFMKWLISTISLNAFLYFGKNIAVVSIDNPHRNSVDLLRQFYFPSWYFRLTL